jgi:hypothetical protein
VQKVKSASDELTGHKQKGNEEREIDCKKLLANAVFANSKKCVFLSFLAVSLIRRDLLLSHAYVMDR